MSAEPGETFVTPVAHLACVAGSLDELTHMLVRLQESLLTDLPESEQALPVIFNEWCTNWGSPSHEKTLALARRLQGTGVKYLVIDDGWAVRPLRIGSRRFWNLNDPWVTAYLDKKLIGFLKENGFGYLKVDYNDTIGIGCDHRDSQGEGLRQQVDAIHRTFRRLSARVPDLVIENCSSGGHRLEPAMLRLTSMSSFSDAHEALHLPIIARQLHHLVPPRQSQIWAVLHPDDTAERFVFSLTATFYGRMCLSGPVHDLADEQMATVRRATQLYARVAPIIREGRTTFLGETPFNWNNPNGWQGIWRENVDGDHALLVVHVFDDVADEAVVVEIPRAEPWRIVACLEDGTTAAPFVEGGRVHLPAGRAFRGYALLLACGPAGRLAGGAG